MSDFHDAQAGPSHSRAVPGSEIESDTEKVWEDTAKENWREIQAMGDKEIEVEKRELEERFGAKTMELLKKRAEERSKGRYRSTVAQKGTSSWRKDKPHSAE